MTKGIDEITTSGVSPGALPLLRVRLCGPFHMEWVDQTSGNPYLSADPSIGGRDRAAALSLLALLLCQPNRQAHRDWVMEQFWPEGSRDVAIHRLENIFSCLRKLLRFPSGGESLVRSIIGKKSSGPSYCLDAYPTLWVDRDALIWQVEQACRMERFGDDALPFWQRAFDLLSRGAFLADDPYDPYAAWVKEQRDRYEGYARQCVHALSRLYLSTYGEAGKPEILLILRTYWQRHQTDEDALRPLLELLGEQERYQEAEQYYQQLLLMLAEQEPDEQGQPRSPDPRTYDLAEYLRTKQLRRTTVSVSSLAPVVQFSQTTLRKTGFAEQGVLVPIESGMWLPHTLSVQTPSFETASLDVATWFGAKVNDLKAFGTFQHEHVVSIQQQQALIHGEIETWSKMTDQDYQPSKEYHISRRMALATLATLSTSLLTKVQIGPFTSLVIEDFLAESSTSIVTCWHLLRGDGLVTVEHTLPKYLPLLIALIKQYPYYKTKTSYLASQGFLLLSLVALHRLHFSERIVYCKRAVEFARESGDRTLLVASLMHLGDAFFTNGQKAEMLHSYSQAEAESQSSEISMFLRSKVLAELAHAYAQDGKEQEALRSVGEARTMFAEERSDTPVFLSTDYGIFQLILFEGLGALALGNCKEVQGNSHWSHKYYQDASNKLNQIDQISQTIIVPERINVEISNQRAFAAMKVGDLDLFEKYFIEGAQGAKDLGSEKRRQEAVANWQAAREHWPDEKRVSKLVDIFF